MTDEELGTDFPTQIDVTLDDLPRRDESDEEHLRRSERFHQREKNQNYNGGVDNDLADQGFPLACKNKSLITKSNDDPNHKTSKRGETIYRGR